MEQWQEDEENPMEVVDDGLVNEEGLYDNLEDGLNEKKRMDALFLLQTKEANRLTQKATDNIMQGAKALVKVRSNCYGWGSKTDWTARVSDLRLCQD